MSRRAVAIYPPARSTRSRKTGQPWVPRETVSKPGSPLPCRSEARTVAGARFAGARIQEPEFVAWRIYTNDLDRDRRLQAQLDWAAGPEASVERVANHRQGIRALVRRLSQLKPDRIVVESTGGYERPLLQALAEAGLGVVLVNPWRVRRFGEGLGKLAKTDAIDARLLAHFGAVADLKSTPVRLGRQRLLADLVARRRQLLAFIVAEKNRVALAPRVVRREIASLIQILERRVARLDRKVDALLGEDPERSQVGELLRSVPGVGPAVARTLLVDLPELGALGRREIASLVGVAPFARDSGLKRGLRYTRAGRASPRTALYMASVTGARCNPVLHALYQRLRAAGKPPKLALIALARKLLTILNAMVREQTPWRDAHA